MNSRNYDNMPPIANNTVTISTTGPQVRLASTGMRPIAVPLRPQPVPIRKMVHDGGGGNHASTSGSGMQPIQFASMHHQVKEEDNLDYQTASTSSGPLIASGPSSNSFQQYQRGSVLLNVSGNPSSSSALASSSNSLGGPSTSGSGALVVNNNGGGANNNSMAMDQPAPVNLASKVAEVFLTAGHAFQKLGDLTLQLHTTTDADESKWSEREVDNLKNALTRFAHELDQISSCVANRTTKHIKNDIKRRHLLADDNQQQPVKRIALSAGPSGSGGATGYTAMRTDLIGAAVPLTQKRVAMQPMGKMMTTRAMAPTRYTVAPISGSSALLPNSAVVVSSSSSGAHGGSPSPAGMPQLHSQGGSSSSAAMSQQRLIGGQSSSSSSLSSGVMIPSTSTTMTTRVMAPQQMIGKLVPPKHTMTTRGMTPSSGALTMQPVSGALILEHND